MHPAAMAIRDAILHHSDSVLMDETTLKVEMTDDYIDDYVESSENVDWLYMQKNAREWSTYFSDMEFSFFMDI